MPVALPRNENVINDEVKEIISYRPHWMIRNGNTIFLIIIVALISLTWVISYPDIIKGSARIVSVNAPKMILAKTDSKLEKLLVQNEQMVRSKQHLAYLKGTSNYDEVMQLQKWIETTVERTNSNDLSSLLIHPLPNLKELGELQESYQEFQTVVADVIQVFPKGYFYNKKITLFKDKQYLSVLKKNSEQQKLILEQSRDLQKKEQSVYESLVQAGAYAAMDVYQYKYKMLATDQSIESRSAELINSDFVMHNKNKELLELEKSVHDIKQKFISSLLNLKSLVEKWIEQYVIITPEDGKVYFVKALQENQSLNNNEELFFVQSDKSAYFVEMMIGQNGLGKVKVGQKVILKTASFPSSEYGFVDGKVSYISVMPNERDSFLAKIDLPNGLKTNLGKQVFFRNNLIAEADIITDERKLADRLFGTFKKIFERN